MAEKDPAGLLDELMRLAQEADDKPLMDVIARIQENHQEWILDELKGLDMASIMDRLKGNDPEWTLDVLIRLAQEADDKPMMSVIERLKGVEMPDELDVTYQKEIIDNFFQYELSRNPFLGVSKQQFWDMAGEVFSKAYNRLQPFYNNKEFQNPRNIPQFIKSIPDLTDEAKNRLGEVFSRLYEDIVDRSMGLNHLQKAALANEKALLKKEVVNQMVLNAFLAHLDDLLTDFMIQKLMDKEMLHKSFLKWQAFKNSRIAFIYIMDRAMIDYQNQYLLDLKELEQLRAQNAQSKSFNRKYRDYYAGEMEWANHAIAELDKTIEGFEKRAEELEDSIGELQNDMDALDEAYDDMRVKRDKHIDRLHDLQEKHNELQDNEHHIQQEIGQAVEDKAQAFSAITPEAREKAEQRKAEQLQEDIKELGFNPETEYSALQNHNELFLDVLEEKAKEHGYEEIRDMIKGNREEAQELGDNELISIMQFKALLDNTPHENKMNRLMQEVFSDARVQERLDSLGIKNTLDDGAPKPADRIMEEYQKVSNVKKRLEIEKAHDKIVQAKKAMDETDSKRNQHKDFLSAIQEVRRKGSPNFYELNDLLKRSSPYPEHRAQIEAFIREELQKPDTLEKMHLAGLEVYQKDEQGKLVLDENGQRVPLDRDGVELLREFKKLADITNHLERDYRIEPDEEGRWQVKPIELSELIVIKQKEINFLKKKYIQSEGSESIGRALAREEAKLEDLKQNGSPDPLTYLRHEFQEQGLDWTDEQIQAHMDRHLHNRALRVQAFEHYESQGSRNETVTLFDGTQTTYAELYHNEHYFSTTESLFYSMATSVNNVDYFFEQENNLAKISRAGIETQTLDENGNLVNKKPEVLLNEIKMLAAASELFIDKNKMERDENGVFVMGQAMRAQLHQDFKAFLSELGIEYSDEQIDKYLDAQMYAIQHSKESLKGELAEFQRRMDEVRDNPALSPKEKDEQLDQISQEMKAKHIKDINATQIISKADGRIDLLLKYVNSNIRESGSNVLSAIKSSMEDADYKNDIYKEQKEYAMANEAFYVKLAQDVAPRYQERMQSNRQAMKEAKAQIDTLSAEVDALNAQMAENRQAYENDQRLLDFAQEELKLVNQSNMIAKNLKSAYEDYKELCTEQLERVQANEQLVDEIDELSQRLEGLKGPPPTASIEVIQELEKELHKKVEVKLENEARVSTIYETIIKLKEGPNSKIEQTKGLLEQRTQQLEALRASRESYLKGHRQEDTYQFDLPPMAPPPIAMSFRHEHGPSKNPDPKNVKSTMRYSPAFEHEKHLSHEEFEQSAKERIKASRKALEERFAVKRPTPKPKTKPDM